VTERSNEPSAAPPLDAWQPRTLGPATRPSPLQLSTEAGDGVPDYVVEEARVLHDPVFHARDPLDASRSLEIAGPRQRIYFDPPATSAAIVTAGGLCPGTNNVIRSLVMQLHHRYGVPRILGYRYGFAGLDPESGIDAMPLGPDVVAHIHGRGGTILGTSRGERDVERMSGRLVDDRIDMLFVIGGDGTMRAAGALTEAVERRGHPIAIIGIPKTIDNDIAFVDKSFGFETAVATAKLALDAAHTEATSARGGIGLVRLMGRDAGFIAAHATLASRDVNVCLVPEVPFALEGPSGLLEFLRRRLQRRGHALVVVAEGCARALADEATGPKDASGNLRFADRRLDIGRALEERITEFFAGTGDACSVKYIDPSYMIRGVAANASDASFCDELARHAAHAAMAGKTSMMIGRSSGVFTHVPLPLVLGVRRRIDADDRLWLAVTETTGQPAFH
jgi:6-phosphofructokinase 1